MYYFDSVASTSVARRETVRMSGADTRGQASTSMCSLSRGLTEMHYCCQDRLCVGNSRPRPARALPSFPPRPAAAVRKSRVMATALKRHVPSKPRLLRRALADEVRDPAILPTFLPAHPPHFSPHFCCLTSQNSTLLALSHGRCAS